MRDEIRQFLVSNRAQHGSQTFHDDDSLLELGIIDSAMMVDLITFLEGRYQLRIDDDEMTPENFDSLDGIVSLVSRKQGVADPPSPR